MGNKTFRFIAALALFFFSWSNLGIYNIAYAATQDRGQNTEDRSQTKEKTAEEKFQESLERLRDAVDKEDAGKLKAERGEIEKLDVEIKNQFKATEQKIKDLPAVIKQRHADFVKKYEENLNTLKANLNEIEKAKTKEEKKQAHQKAKDFLEKTKPPSRHVPLDPNKLPHRTPDVKKKEPRLKKEDFDKEFGSQKAQILPSPSLLNQSHVSSPQSPILIASNGPLTGLLSPNSEFLESPSLYPSPLTGEGRVGVLANAGWGLPSNDSIGGEGLSPNIEPTESLRGLQSVAISPNVLVATATNLPTPADLSETIEVQFTDDIKAKAAELNNNPVKIYEWVRNNIEFVPTYGSIQGADMCLKTRQCNSFDTASLLIALLRTSSVSARYVYGTIELPIDKVMNWVGGFTDPASAVNFVASGGIPIKAYTSGGKIAKVQMEHVFVEAWISYGNYRGTKMDDSIKTWIPMDGSYKDYEYTSGIDMTETVPFNQNDYLSRIQSQNPVHYYQSQIQAYLDANMPDKTIIDVKGYREITQETFHFLPATLPYKTIVVGSKFAGISSNFTAMVTFTLANTATGSSVSYTSSTPELSGKRITVSYIPATSNDETLIAGYGGFLYDVPAYLLNLTPVLRIEGAIKLTGEAATLGSEQSLALQFLQPSGMNEAINKKLIVGAYCAVGMDLQGINENVLGKRNYQLTTSVLSETAGTLGNDDLIGEHLYILATTYHLANDKIYKAGAKIYNTAVTRMLSEGITSFTLSVSYLFSIPKTAIPSGIEMDVAMDRQIAISKDGNTAKEKAYMEIAGLVSSYHEHDIFERIDEFSSVSAVRALQVANSSGIPIYQINSANIGQQLPQLNITSEIKTDIQNAVNAGKEVTISQTNIQINDWNGVGYIVKDPITGSGAYMISGGLAGGGSTSHAAGAAIAQAFMTPLQWVLEVLNMVIGGTIAMAAQLDIGERIANAAVELEGTQYKFLDCSALVRKAYWAGGICLDEFSPCKPNLANAYGLKWTKGLSGATYLYIIASDIQLSPYGGIINEVDTQKGIPHKGDMVFFNYGTSGVYNHMGIIISLPDKDGTMTFVDTTASDDANENKMNLQHPSDNKLNEPLLSKPCTKCYAGELFSGFGTVRDPKKK